MAKQLELIFETGLGKTYRMTVADPRDDVTGAEVKAAMDTVVAKNIINVEGELTGVREANIITTTEQALTLA